MAAADRDASATSAPLAGPWTFAWTAPGAAADPAALDALGPRWLPAVVPGTVAGALRALAATGALDGVAPPARLDGADWWFRCRFAAPPPAPGERLSLRFDGLATIAEVFLNGAPLLRSENMFVASAAEIGDRLRDGNDLVMRFAALDPLLAARRPRPRWRAPMVEHQQLRWFRTTLLGRTPGWSPPAPPVGPWRPVRLQRARAFAVQSRDLRVSLQGDTGLVAVTLQLESLGGARLGGGRLVVTGADGRAREAPLAPRFPEGAGPVSLSATVSIPGAAVWWPHTHGAQPLYAARAQIDVAGADPLAVELGRVGFRTVGLATEGGDFALSVNGTPIFCRGACWTPVDAVSLADAPDALRETLLAARDAGMNMVRVCGPLLYESDTFHDLCDQLGILVWQDFMFANMDYPEDAAFVASVKAEAEQALRRWQARPSLGVLCGDSEGEQQAAMWGAPRAAWHRPLFRETLAALARALCPDVPYWPSSASGGAFPHQPSAGTTSYYGVGAYRRPLDDARRCNLRFASECLGFGNIPDDAALAALASGAPVRPHTPSWK
ncbi:MAG TPA: glycoside hydrolase family 2 protein, partial [Polyangia bacterium]|nr:glycoside hydrolase family 2 protein [Polyangia bacterium]